MLPDHIATVRRFNRLVTQRAGALNDDFLGRHRPLGESRLLYEIGEEGADIRDLRLRLGLDSGYLSRLIKSLEGRGLVKVGQDPSDERVRRATLSARGRREVREMNERSDDAASALLVALSESQRIRLVAAMGEVHRLLRLAGLEIDRVDPASAAARWCVEQYFAEINRRFESGFDPAAATRAPDQELVPPRGAFLMGSVDGEPVACGAVMTIGPALGYLKRMWVADSLRGLGLGRRMLAALEDQARSLGHTTVRLETNRALTEAIQLYRSAGYHEIPAFNTDPYGDNWFEKDLKP
jgi:DNA-binding MarR family transcriptional regulator/predicted GNAT family acetyltransferase